MRFSFVLNLIETLGSFCIMLYLPLRMMGHLYEFPVWIFEGIVLSYVLIAAAIQRPELHSKKILQLFALGFPFVSFFSLFDVYSGWLFIPKLIWFYKARRIRHILHDLDRVHPMLHRLLPLSVIVPTIVHWVACGWIYLGSGNAGRQEQFADEYVKAFYWSITTLATVGYGDITPKTNGQMLYATLVMIIGVGFFGYILSNIASMLARLDMARENHLAALDKIEIFMRDKKMPSRIRQNVRSYYQFMWKQYQGYSYDEILTELPSSLQSDIRLHLNKKMLNRIPIFKGADKDVLSNLVLEFQQRLCLPNEVLFRAGDHGEEMYFIHQGQLQVLDENGQEVSLLEEGDFFGELAIIENTLRSATVRSLSYCELSVLSRSSFESITSRFPEFSKNIQHYARNRKVKTMKAS